MRLDKDSYGAILIAWAVGLVALAALWWFVGPLWITIPVTVIVVLLLLFITWFFRVPDRVAPEGESLITSVCDGKVLSVEEVFENEYLRRKCIQVSIYMDFFDVHCNFWPVSGVVSYYKYHPGKYFLAFHPKSSELNEHASSAIRTRSGKEILFKQIAGTFARRIVCYSEPGLAVTRGAQCGVIKFGSRIDMFLPIDAKVQVKPGDITRAVETVIATL